MRLSHWKQKHLDVYSLKPHLCPALDRWSAQNTTYKDPSNSAQGLINYDVSWNSWAVKLTTNFICLKLSPRLVYYYIRNDFHQPSLDQHWSTLAALEFLTLNRCRCRSAAVCSDKGEQLKCRQSGSNLT